MSYPFSQPDHPDTCIRTASGRLLDLAAPSPDDVLLTDIAQALARLERYTGHCPLHPTVAQHSLAVEHIATYLLPEKVTQADMATVRRAALMHDAQEAYVTDLSAPAKRALRLRRDGGQRVVNVYDDMEDRLAAVIRAKFDSEPGDWQPLIHLADQFAWAYESAWDGWAKHLADELPTWLKYSPYVARCYGLARMPHDDGGHASFLRRANALGLFRNA